MADPGSLQRTQQRECLTDSTARVAVIQGAPTTAALSVIQGAHSLTLTLSLSAHAEDSMIVMAVHHQDIRARSLLVAAPLHVGGVICVRSDKEIVLAAVRQK